MKVFLLILLNLVSIISFSQNIELVSEVKGLKNNSDCFIGQHQNGFVLANTYYIQIFHKDRNTLLTKEWKSIPFEEVKYNEKEQKNTILNPEFNPFGAVKVDDGILVYVYYEPTSGKAKILEYKFTDNLDFISERVLTSMIKCEYGSKDYAFTEMDFFKSTDSDFFVFAQYTISSKKTGYKHAFEYQILDFDFNVVRSGSMNMPVYKPGVPDYLVGKNVVKSIEVLRAGDPLINLGGALFLIDDNEFIPLNISPSMTISSYKIRQDSKGGIVLLGTYSSNEPKNKKHTGYVIMRFNNDLEVVSEEYGNFNEDFYLSTTELIKKNFPHTADSKDELGAKSKGKYVDKKPAVILDAYMNDDGTILAAFSGCTRFEANSYSQNIALVKIDIDDKITAESDFPLEVPMYELTSRLNRLKVIFEKNMIYLFCWDFKENYSLDNSYFPPANQLGGLSNFGIFSIMFFDSDEKHSFRKAFFVDINNQKFSRLLSEERFPERTYYILYDVTKGKETTTSYYSVYFE